MSNTTTRREVAEAGFRPALENSTKDVVTTAVQQHGRAILLGVQAVYIG
jgi:hypothetical protein